MKSLCRTRVDKFDILDSYSFEQIENGDFKVLSMEEVMSSFPKLTLPEEKKNLFLNGVKINSVDKINNNVYNIYIKNKYLGLAIMQDGYLKRDIIIGDN